MRVDPLGGGRTNKKLCPQGAVIEKKAREETETRMEHLIHEKTLEKCGKGWSRGAGWQEFGSSRANFYEGGPRQGRGIKLLIMKGNKWRGELIILAKPGKKKKRKGAAQRIVSYFNRKGGRQFYWV